LMQALHNERTVLSSTCPCTPTCNTISINS
jgi:hypothetical protein